MPLTTATLDQHYLARALQLAAEAEGHVAPNPMVGCVIVGADGLVLAEGYHKAYGGPHAEIEALRLLPQPANLTGATVYVSLEPCAHHGKTPPCADALVAAGPARVVAATQDPNPLVAGQGFAKLRAAGIAVQEGPLLAEARIQNRRFITQQQLGRPFITLKWAQTGDGYIARADYTSQWITGPAARAWAHRARAKHQAIAVGFRTTLHDNPTLTTRLWPGPSPVRLVIDPLGALPPHLHVMADGHPTLHLVQEGAESVATPLSGYQKIALPVGLPLAQGVVHVCQAAGLQSVLIEGGGALLNQFIKENLWDEALVFAAPAVRFGPGSLPAPVLPPAALLESENIGPDTVQRLANTTAGFWHQNLAACLAVWQARLGQIPGYF